MIGNALHINKQFQHDKTCFRSADTLVQPFHMALAHGFFHLPYLVGIIQGTPGEDEVVVLQRLQGAFRRLKDQILEPLHLQLGLGGKAHALLIHGFDPLHDGFGVVADALDVAARMQQPCMHGRKFRAHVLFRQFRQIDRNGFFQIIDDGFMFLDVFRFLRIIRLHARKGAADVAQGEAAHADDFLFGQAQGDGRRSQHIFIEEFGLVGNLAAPVRDDPFHQMGEAGSQGQEKERIDHVECRMGIGDLPGYIICRGHGEHKLQELPHQ